MITKAHVPPVYSAFNEAIGTSVDGRMATRYNELAEPDLFIRKALVRFANASDPASWHGVRPSINAVHSDIREWGRYKYIAHVAGVTCSHKLEKAINASAQFCLHQPRQRSCGAAVSHH